VPDATADRPLRGPGGPSRVGQGHVSQVQGFHRNSFRLVLLEEKTLGVNILKKIWNTVGTFAKVFK
jgi:hypothetical protein